MFASADNKQLILRHFTSWKAQDQPIKNVAVQSQELRITSCWRIRATRVASRCVSNQGISCVVCIPSSAAGVAAAAAATAWPLTREAPGRRARTNEQRLRCRCFDCIENPQTWPELQRFGRRRHDYRDSGWWRWRRTRQRRRQWRPQLFVRPRNDLSF